MDLKTITRIELSVMDPEGKIIATTEDGKLDDYNYAVPDFVSSQAESQLVQGLSIFQGVDDHNVEYVISARGEAEDVYKIGKIASFQIQNLLVAYKERFDKDNFVKNLLLDNLTFVRYL
jgi:carbohydrate diacid regulator